MLTRCHIHVATGSFGSTSVSCVSLFPSHPATTPGGQADFVGIPRVEKRVNAVCRVDAFQANVQN